MADEILHLPMSTESKNPDTSPPQNANFKDLTPYHKTPKED